MINFILDFICIVIFGVTMFYLGYTWNDIIKNIDK